MGVFIFLAVGGSVAIGIDITFFTPTKDEMCQSIGMKEYVFIMDTHYCVDYDNNAHFVNIKCKGFMLSKECTAQIISIGDIRVKEVSENNE